MRRIAVLIFGSLLCAPLGCAQHASVRLPCFPGSSCPQEITTSSEIVPVVSAILSQGDDTNSLSHSASEVFQPVRLTAEDCQFRAVAAASLSDLVEYERALATALAECESCRKSKPFALTAKLLALRAEEKRHQAAFTAMQSYYQLAELEGTSQRLQETKQELANVASRIQKLRAKNLVGKEMQYASEQRQLKLLDQLAQLALSREQLNAQLQTLMGCQNEFQVEGLQPNYWPEISWHLEPSVLDTDAEVAKALASRHDLLAINLVLGQLNRDTLPVARTLLQASESTLGSIAKPKTLLPWRDCEDFECQEVTVRREQLIRLLATLSAKTTAEVRAAVSAIRSARERAVIANQLLALRNKELQDQKKKLKAETTSWQTVSEAKLEVWLAEIELIKRIIAVRQAETELKNIQGVLAKGFMAVE